MPSGWRKSNILSFPAAARLVGIARAVNLMHHGLWLGALVLVTWAGWLDWRSRRIPNWLTVPGLFVGLAAHTVVLGWAGAKLALAGTGVALALLLPLVLLRGLGAGDWKLMGALGAFLGPTQIILVLLATVFVAGIMAFLQITRLRRWREVLANLWELLRGFLAFRLAPHPTISLDNPGLLSLPFGTAAAIGTLLCYGSIWI